MAHIIIIIRFYINVKLKYVNEVNVYSQLIVEAFSLLKLDVFQIVQPCS
jgi:hypothetical protein